MHPTSETAVVASLLQQQTAVLGAVPEQQLLDAGYSSIAVLAHFVEHDVDVLIPTGRAFDDDSFEKSDASFAKSRFAYNAATDSYRCPAGQDLVVIGRGKTEKRYGGAPCAACAHRQKCTPGSKNGRTVIRGVGDEYKEAMREVLKHPKAKERYRQRPGIVERPFIALKRMVPRFRRRGLAAVRLEWALACMAYNFKAFMALFIVVVRPHPSDPGRLQVTLLATICVRRH